MDMALNYMGELGAFLTEKEDLAILGDQEELASKVVNEHIDMMEKMNEEFLRENEEADK